MDFPRLADYLAALARNNEKAWFEANRAEYQALRDDFTALVGEVIAGIAEWEPDVRWLDPKDCIFRIHRDVRFSSDKSPYKTTFSAWVNEQGRRGDGPGYYFHVDEQGTLLVAGGVYMPQPEPLARIRDHIAEHPERLRRLIRSKALRDTFGEIRGERLKRPPRGYAPDHPLIEQIKLKSFILSRERDVRAEPDGIAEWMIGSFRAMAPFIAWLRAALVEPPVRR
jgi:uncharacterized protein (TIGR02453 family)